MSLWDKRRRSGPEESLDSEDVLELLSSLVEKSLVVLDGATGRYRLLETVRQYGIERLVDGDESDGIRGRHLDYFLALAEEAEPHLKGAEQQAWLERLEAEHDNVRAALGFAPFLSTDSGLRLAGALSRFWMVRGHFGEGRRWLGEMLDQAWAQAHTEARGKALTGASLLAHSQGNYASARALYEESLAICRDLGDRRGIAMSLNNLGSVAQRQGDYRAAGALFELALEIDRGIGNRAWIATNLNNMGNVAREQGDYSSARGLHEESLAIKRELGDRAGIANSLEGLAQLVSMLSGPYRAARIWGAAERLREEIGSPLPLRERPDYDRHVAGARTALGDDAAFDRAWREGRAMTLEEAAEYALKDRINFPD